MERIEVNVITGESHIVPLTQQEIEDIASRPQPAPVSAIDMAERHIAKYFSTHRLIQLKVWYDQFPNEDIPKLAAVFDWTASITIKAAQGNTDFHEPPHSFEELLVEAMEQLGVTP